MSMSEYQPSSETEIFKYLQRRFNGADTISTTEFRKFVGVSKATDGRMRNTGNYPRIIQLPGSLRFGRILLLDLAKWLACGGCSFSEEEYAENAPLRKAKAFKKNGEPAKKRGRPAGQKNNTVPNLDE